MEVMTTKNWLLKLASNGYSRFFLRSKMKVDTDAIFVVKRINLYAYDLNGTHFNLISVYIYTLNGVWLISHIGRLPSPSWRIL